jgi:hypothetical protein
MKQAPSDPSAPRPARASWGASIQRDLAVLAPLLALGCSPPPPEVAPAPSPPPVQAKAPPPAIEPVADGEGAAMGVGPLVHLDETVEESPFQYNFSHHAVPSGSGVFSFYEFESENGRDGAPICALKTPFPDVCMGFSFAPWKGAPPWPGAWLPARGDDRLEPDGKLTASPISWDRISPGTQGVYACNTQRIWDDTAPVLEIDFLRPDGAIEPFLKDTTGRFSDALVVEVPGGHLGIFRQTPVAAANRMYRSVGGLVAAPIVGAGKERKVGALKPLQIGDVWYDGRASDARDARSSHKRAGYGPFRAVALMDAKGKPSGDVALVWVEVFPPPGHEELAEKKKKTEVRKGKGKNQCGRPDRTSFGERVSQRRPFFGAGGCGGRASRSLSSTDVQKRLHVTRLTSAGEPREDRAIDLPKDHNAEKDPLVVVARPGGGLAVNHMTFDGQLRRGKDLPVGEQPAVLDPPTLEGPRPQRLLQAAFDQRSGEALLIVGEAADPGVPAMMGLKPTPMSDVVAARTTSALGKPLGKPLLLPELRDTMERPAMARGGGGWLVVGSDGQASFRVIGGPHHEALHPFPVPECDGKPCPFSLLSMMPALDGRVELLTTTHDPKNSATYATLIHLDSLLSTPPREVNGGAKDTFPALDNRGELRGEDGALLRWTLSDDGVASLVDPSRKEDKAPEEASGDQKDRKTEPAFQWEMHLVWGDVVIVATRGKQARATWLKAHQTIDFETDKMPEQDGFMQLRGGSERGPVLPGGLWILPSTPGPLLPAPSGLKATLKSCPVTMPTGPRRLLLACSEAIDDQRPTVRVGTRVVRF